jgi:hypothetical protein
MDKKLCYFQKEFVASWCGNLYCPKMNVINMATSLDLLTYAIGKMKDNQRCVKFMTNLRTFLSRSCTLGVAGRRLRPNKTGYGPIFSSNGKWLGNRLLRTGYGPTTISWRGRTTNLKWTRHMSTLHQSFFSSQWLRAGRISPPVILAWPIPTSQPSMHPGPY